MTSNEARELFSAALEGELSPEEQQRFTEALAQDADLSGDYREFVACNAALRASHAAIGPVPDLLRGVQSRLRSRSRGRFYPDRFSERSGASWQPTLLLAVLMLALLALCWLGFNWFDAAVRVVPSVAG
jgi:anti-sigma factor RsiW